ncbi:KpsF/GutQ family sugar-phosphate isomerase [Alteromonas sp. LMIT006]|uniref:KpsF/GutQ family sugar-phosphate isomerase n=1 Tax=Alteromonadaceae TaxID=72275 RepID=UPI0020CA5D5A|nr:KpsF/GutQ family sugar-phosphate isomerase [Alteromonas sp. LMIT006]UTP72829.1 KpsF/GutQ family sugar-phosphate isomerase [Alteromonas sp. LMIT006]
MSEHHFIQSAKQVIATEAKGLAELPKVLDETFVAACQLLKDCQGKVVVSGMGKSGHIGSKIAATLASTGTPAFFVHPGEANHGDLGMLSANDVVIAISNSGETQELLGLLPVLKRLNIPYIAITQQAESTLAQHAELVLTIPVPAEACSLGLAPTTSTTVTLVLGDALAIALLDAKGFTSEDFALSHPGGSLGRKLLLRCSDIMLRGEEIPSVNTDTLITEALLEISRKGLGMTGVVADERLKGIFTDGDLRRVLDQKIDIHRSVVENVMTANPITVSPEMLAVDALNIMQQKQITALLVVDQEHNIVGAFNMHMLLKAGVV